MESKVNIFSKKNAKPARAIETQQIQLGAFSEAGLVLLLALVLPQEEVSHGFFAPVYLPVVGGLRQQLQTMWLRRGAPAIIELPERLPALSIELSTQVFRNIAELLRTQTPIGGEATATSNPQISDAIGLIEKLLAALGNCRVEVKG
jgi:hypothetical protein